MESPEDAPSFSSIVRPPHAAITSPGLDFRHAGPRRPSLRGVAAEDDFSFSDGRVLASRRESSRGCLVMDGAGGAGGRSYSAVGKRVSFQLNEIAGGGSGRRSAGREKQKAARGKQQAGVIGFLAAACRQCQAFEPTKYAEANNNTRKVVANFSKVDA